MCECCGEGYVWDFEVEVQLDAGAKDFKRDADFCIPENRNARGDLLADIHWACRPDWNPA